MNPNVRYQVFLSSTYDDLRESRQQATQAILEAGCFPSGMELFPASDDNQWELIKRVISECDYYIVIVGARYGSIAPSGLSYTEMEYDYAVEQDIPVLGFVLDDPDSVSRKFTDKSDEHWEKLQEFRQKVMSRTCVKYSDPKELGLHVMKSIAHESRVRPQVGWVKANQARSEEDRQRELRIIEQLEEVKKEKERLERDLRDRMVVAEELNPEKLAQGEDIFEITVMYQDSDKNPITDIIPLTWNEIFETIGPSMYGYVVRKTKSFNEPPKYPFQIYIEQKIRSKIYDKIKNRKMTLDQSQIDTCVIQFKELGLIKFEETEDENDGGVFRGITLTEHGEKQLAKLKTRKRKES